MNFWFYYLKNFQLAFGHHKHTKWSIISRHNCAEN